MSFQDCSRGKVRFEVGRPSDFRVSEGGVVSTSRRLSLGTDRAVEGLVYARDLHTQQVWKTKLYLLAKPPQVGVGTELRVLSRGGVEIVFYRVGR